jgi:hypothetical protein
MESDRRLASRTVRLPSATTTPSSGDASVPRCRERRWSRAHQKVAKLVSTIPHVTVPESVLEVRIHSAPPRSLAVAAFSGAQCDPVLEADASIERRLEKIEAIPRRPSQRGGEGTRRKNLLGLLTGCSVLRTARVRGLCCLDYPRASAARLALPSGPASARAQRMGESAFRL